MYHFKCNVCRREFKCNKMVRYCIFCGSPRVFVKDDSRAKYFIAVWRK